ncbi:hypothetical protein ETAE_p004 (plasmid) [Edwardsiella piscicida]|uniref:Uncharacterized protein n=1 Tax=Edwardsiella piscicida TaxID=1263550 RepID=A0AAU8PVB8_EDWPI|nr:hypothetical protein ETAE_p004 [Edwardsiella tarda EIB202]
MADQLDDFRRLVVNESHALIQRPTVWNLQGVSVATEPQANGQRDTR